MNGSALGLIETRGLIGLINAYDAMLKAANVEVATPVIKLDGGVVSGDDPGRRQQRPRRRRGGRGGRGPLRRAEGRPRHPEAVGRGRQGVRRRLTRMRNCGGKRTSP